MRSSLDEVYRQYIGELQRYLYFLCRNHHTAEDLVQETFYRAYLYLESYSDEKVKAWLFRVAHNVFIDRLRKEGRVDLYEAEYFERAADKETPETLWFGHELSLKVKRILEALPLAQRQAWLLYEVHGFTYAEGAGILDISLASYKIALFRARHKLREKLQEGGSCSHDRGF
ncbi:RNA polymerase subunit sigma-24 [Paenibacillus sp. CAA11]|uniref:sigma-70 family RNA polymerase sigma factor n=1 Tax=Paenibacillus sp. CAA11 TaxID=1532905 RepID=UPI000D350B7A|nr:sigma-70 family RNA polymerase sigma factor [Paenibacillus sp. CAA11]AWB44072.1 RNA polymerase subunit sigma-24 [Paenibacillus sp. CAA11]